MNIIFLFNALVFGGESNPSNHEGFFDGLADVSGICVSLILMLWWCLMFFVMQWWKKTQRLRVVKLKRVGLCEEGCNIGTKKWGSFQKSHDSYYPIIFIGSFTLPQKTNSSPLKKWWDLKTIVSSLFLVKWSLFTETWWKVVNFRMVYFWESPTFPAWWCSTERIAEKAFQAGKAQGNLQIH